MSLNCNFLQLDMLQLSEVTVGRSYSCLWLQLAKVTVVCGYSWQKLQLTFYTCLLTPRNMPSKADSRQSPHASKALVQPGQLQILMRCRERGYPCLATLLEGTSGSLLVGKSEMLQMFQRPGNILSQILRSPKV